MSVHLAALISVFLSAAYAAQEYQDPDPELTQILSPEANILAICSDVESCEELAAAVMRYDIAISTVTATHPSLRRLIGDGSTLRSVFDAVFIQQGVDLSRDLDKEVIAVIADAVSLGVGLVLEGGPQAFVNAGLEDSYLARCLPGVSIGEDTRSYRTGRTDRPTVMNEHSPLLRYLGWRGAPAASSYCLLHARRDATVHLTADGLPILLDWVVGKGRVVQFAGGLTGQWAKDWERWRSFDAFRARLLLAASGMDDSRLKAVLPRK